MADVSRPAELQVETREEQSGVAVVRVSGELDVSNAETLESVVAQVCDGNPAELVFDLRELNFMDSAGIAVLLGGARRVPSVRLRDPTPAVRRVVEVTGLATVLRLGDEG
jgi:anti-sigma B factor antagonist